MQTLWGLLAKRQGFDARNREFRLVWAGGKVGREVGSYKDLSRQEAETVIDAVQGCLPAEAVQRRRRPARRLAHEIGTAGRRGYKAKTDALPDARAWQRLQAAIDDLGWTRERLDLFIHSAASPTRGRAIRTLADLNAVHWALKGILRRARRSG